MKWAPSDSQNERVQTVSFRIQAEDITLAQVEPVVGTDPQTSGILQTEKMSEENLLSGKDTISQTAHVPDVGNLLPLTNTEPKPLRLPNNGSQEGTPSISRHFSSDPLNASNRPEMSPTSNKMSTYTSHVFIKDTWSPSYSSTIDLISPSIQEPMKETSHVGVMGGLLALSVGLGNIWRLPMILFAPYPGETLIAYLILMTVVGVPLIILELGLGQFTSAGVTRLWRAVPLFKGVGIAQLLAGAYTTFYYGPLMAWAFQWGVHGINKWEVCDDLAVPNQTCLCHMSFQECKLNYSVSMGEICFDQAVFSGEDHFNLKLLPMLAVSWVIIFLWLCWGHRFMLKLLCLSGWAAAVLISASLALALSYSGADAAKGLALLKPTQLWAFGRGEVWYGALVQVLFSVPIGFGVLPALSQHFHFKNHFKRDGFIVWFCNITFAMVSVCAVFAWLGVIESAEDLKLELRDPVTLVYVIHYYAALVHPQMASLWAGLMCFLIFLAGINSLVPQSYALISAVIDEFPKIEKYRGIFTAFLCSIMAAVGVSAVHTDGILGVMMWDHYAAGGTVLSCLILHVVGILWIYQYSKLEWDFEFMGIEMGYLWKILFVFVVPILLTVGELWGFLGLPLDGTVDCRFPTWVIGLGWFFYLLAVVVAELGAVKVIISQVEFGIKGKIIAAIKPLRSWGPRDPARHHNYKNNLLGYAVPDANAVSMRNSPVLRSNTTSGIRLEAVKEPIQANGGSSPLGTENSTLRRTSVKVVRVPSTREYVERR